MTSESNFIKRSLILCAGLLVMAFGVAFSIRASLGTSPISSFPYVISKCTPLTVGTATICMHVILISLQIIILRKNYSPFQLLQLPAAIIFGYLTDFALKVTEVINPQNTWQQWLVCAAGIVIVGIGVTLEVKADIIVLAGEGFILAVCSVLPIKFSTMKITFDVSLVVAACITSLVFLGNITGVREGTAAAALLVGCVVKLTNKVIEKIKEERLRIECNNSISDCN